MLAKLRSQTLSSLFFPSPPLLMTTSDPPRLSLVSPLREALPDVSSWVLSMLPIILLLLCLPSCMITVYLLVSPTKLSKDTNLIHSVGTPYTRAKYTNGKYWTCELVSKSLYFSSFEVQLGHTQIHTLTPLNKRALVARASRCENSSTPNTKSKLEPFCLR